MVYSQGITARAFSWGPAKKTLVRPRISSFRPDHCVIYGLTYKYVSKIKYFVSQKLVVSCLNPTKSHSICILTCPTHVLQIAIQALHTPTSPRLIIYVLCIEGGDVNLAANEYLVGDSG